MEYPPDPDSTTAVDDLVGLVFTRAMSFELAAAIHRNEPGILACFAPPFRSKEGWLRSLEEKFGAGGGVGALLDRGPLSITDFHALYIACWLYFPVEKGSYMIRLTDAQRTNVRAGYGLLGARISSHFEGHGRSAARGWNFLQGYHELLVQMEGGGKNSPGEDKYVFLKAEGHTVTSPSHIRAWYHKKTHGTGLMASPTLHAAASSPLAAGPAGAASGAVVTERAAENFDNEYKALLKFLGIYDARKAMTTVQQALASVFQRLQSLIRGVTPACQRAFDARLVAIGAPALAAGEVAGLTNAKLSALLTEVLIPTTHEVHARNFNNGDRYPSDDVLSFTGAFFAALPSLTDIAERLAMDAALTGQERVERAFAEIRVAPATLDTALANFIQVLSATGTWV